MLHLDPELSHPGSTDAHGQLSEEVTVGNDKQAQSSVTLLFSSDQVSSSSN